MLEQKSRLKKGGTMRLGAYPCSLVYGSKVADIYKKDLINERHRHRYEFNNFYKDMLKDKDLKIVGTSPDKNLVEIVELCGHRWFIGVQFHPEFKSRPNKAHPLFYDFIKASLKK